VKSLKIMNKIDSPNKRALVAALAQTTQVQAKIQ